MPIDRAEYAADWEFAFQNCGAPKYSEERGDDPR